MPNIRKPNGLRGKPQPSYQNLAKAINYWAIFEDVERFFEQAQMSGVSRHLAAARKEIDRLWEENGVGFGHERIR